MFFFVLFTIGFGKGIGFIPGPFFLSGSREKNIYRKFVGIKIYPVYLQREPKYPENHHLKNFNMNALFANEMKETREFYLEEISNKKTVSTKKRFLTKCRLQAEDVLIDRERAYNAGRMWNGSYVKYWEIESTREEIKIINDIYNSL